MIDIPLLTIDCVVSHDNRVVLIRRGCEPYVWYALPGGFVEIGESVEQALYSRDERGNRSRNK